MTLQLTKTSSPSSSSSFWLRRNQFRVVACLFDLGVLPLPSTLVSLHGLKTASSAYWAGVLRFCFLLP
ncbi:hypothetical protein PF010_g1036 [Phytophthora fragariae]|uniref:Uncharacterized protein n=1 Tax=Phytophthora fragariae TaxID=53985 RepID=A0A6A4AFY7_9STRA|nr:hypothetical protein PF009_g1328 [Phytophthora fragariae]KAE9030031.1 hypothetical protein PF011_g799 [Phytophthora fragariae]KAE9138206.1 hypothetical protein PF010_g1036 [Phytophthora fragariae]KAE9138989.1 hypothetical protein PF007_g1196 [Phytophthora fragariae]KAE9155002.1 hypothetical protein PF006_g1037 [Phytophthora fragariae]